MNKLQHIKKILNDMDSILKNCNMDDWSHAISQLGMRIEDDPEGTIYKIIMLYGGMGSLNDIVLSKNGEILKDENDHFEMLRNRLHELCLDH